MKETSSRNRTLFKGGLIAVLTLLLLIPTIFISNLIQERQLRKSSVTREIGEKWGLAQTINGPMLKIPFYENVEVFIQEGKKQKKEFSKVLKYKYICPEIVTINSKISPQLRKRGIFEVIVYQSDISMDGSFKDLM
jgi:inner membrane protein